MQQKVLIVEDDKRLSDAVTQILVGHDYDVDAITDGMAGYNAAIETKYDIIILDVMLPGKDGISICQDLRKEGLSVPIIMVTAKSEISDTVLGLDSGADDYLAKPFHPKELLARLKALSRRRIAYGYDGKARYGDVEFNIETGELSKDGESVLVTGKELEIMKVLMSNPGEVFSKDEIISKVWGDNSGIDENNVEAYISFLRKKLKYLGCSTSIRTLRTVGYRLELGI